MPITTHTCHSLQCDVCHVTYEPGEFEMHFPTLAEARSTAEGSDWYANEDGTKVVCSEEDDVHTEFRKAIGAPLIEDIDEWIRRNEAEAADPA